MRFTIAKKLGIGFGLVILLIALTAGIAYFKVTAMTGNVAEVVEQAFPTISACDRLAAGIYQSMAAQRGFVIVGANAPDAARFKADRARAWTEIDRALADLDRLAGSGINEQNKQDVASLSIALASLREMQKKVEETGTEDEALLERMWSSESVPLADQCLSLLSPITNAAQQRRNDRVAEHNVASAQLRYTLILSAVVAIGIGASVGVALSRQIVAAVRQLAARAQLISHGDLTGKPLATKASDELGDLASGFDSMLASLRDLTGQILAVTENVNSATGEISASAKQQAASTKQQAATVQEITSTMLEISQSGSQIVQKAKDVAAAAEATVAAGKSGIDAVQTTNLAVQAIREQVEQVAENIVALSEKTQAVGDIIATVTDVAEQSNLLALNATIEAADAGEQGNRFSVVAGEMKNLADQAKRCTVQVKSILGEIQKGINSAVMLTEEAVKRVESGKQQADVSEQSIHQMSQTTNQSIQAFEQIIAATNQQQIGFDQVTKGMRDIDLATQQTATGTAQLERAVLSLSSLSQQLKRAVASYRV